MGLSSSAPANTAANKAQQHTWKAFRSAAFMHVCRGKRDRVGQNKHVSTAGTPPNGPFTGTFMAPESRAGTSAPKNSREGLKG